MWIRLRSRHRRRRSLVRVMCLCVFRFELGGFNGPWSNTGRIAVLRWHACRSGAALTCCCRHCGFPPAAKCCSVR